MFAKNAWKKYENYDKVMEFAEGYKTFLTNSKTERLAVKECEKLLRAKGYLTLEETKEIKQGTKIYFVNRNKNVLAIKVGSKPFKEGLRILGAHIDSPRLDLKQNPLYEKNGMALLDTHYYGGVKKYQWTTIPLSLIGVVCLKNGITIEVNIGEKEDDPVLGIGDLLIHLSQAQMSQTLGNAIEGENLDVTIGSIPLKGEEKNPVKANVLSLLKDIYGFEEEDFLSAELEVVPSGKTRDYGLDKGMVAGYGHDDRCCAYPSLIALLDQEELEYTGVVILTDKEEVGSIGATGAQSLFFENALLDVLVKANDKMPVVTLKTMLTNSKMLSSDVSAGSDPLYMSVDSPNNTAYMSHGIVLNKYTGSRGKSGANDANPEYLAWIRKIFDENNVNWQTAELGKVDAGGGGTIAYILANYNMDVLDAGLPVLNMHAPMEIISKVDLYEAYLAYSAFLTK